MKKFTYQALGNIKSTTPQPIYNEQGIQIQFVQRIYDNGLKKLLDGYFDYRYFLKYEVIDLAGKPLFQAKKVFRRGKVWFEGKDLVRDENYLINYENWRIGVPELFISNGDFKMKVDKEMESWSTFIVDDVVVAKWLAVYDEQKDLFDITFELSDQSPIQDIAFYIAIAQAALFIGV
ncbi:MAG: peptide ABC transporter ATPase [Solibacillus sp.]|uniref:tubby C-terminal domain-like protein n=1 Tax=Solibacillus sp. TaxID=1909654 RepID=UPI00331481E1